MATIISESGESKSSKKNKKRKEKKLTELKEEVNNKTKLQNEVLDSLKAQLQEAKANKKHAESQKIREEIWVLSDALAGVRTSIPEEELVRIMSSIQCKFPQLNDHAGSGNTSDTSDTSPVQPATNRSLSANNTQPPTTTSSTSTMNDNDHATHAHENKNKIETMMMMMDGGKEDKRMKKLREKLAQIEVLKKRRDGGETLELNQIEKINSEPTVIQEIKEMEEIFNKMS